MSPQLSCMAANGLDTTRTVTLQPPWKKLLMLSSKQYSILLHLFIYYTLYFNVPSVLCAFSACAFSALTLLVGRQEGHPACKKHEWWGTGVVICLERGADLHTAQLMPLPLTVSCSSKIQIVFTFLVPAYPGCPGKEAVKW